MLINYTFIDNRPAYRKLSDAALRFIVKDASEAARNMLAIGDASAEAKYLDQINDATTILAERARKHLRPSA